MTRKANQDTNMNNIQDYFAIDDKTYQTNNIVVFDFDDSKSAQFIQEFVIPYRQSYYSDEDLDYEVNEGINTREKAIENKLPTTPNLRSGEFSEILMFFLSCKVLCSDANVTPIKWRWKEHRDAPCHLTDIALLKCNNSENPSTEDYFFSMEVKSAATPIGNRSKESRFNDAIEGALKDKTSRVGKMVAYLTTKYSKERNAEAAKIAKRFDDGTTVQYQRRFSAAVVSERNSLQYHIANIVASNKAKADTEHIALFAVPMQDLKTIYETMYNITPKQG